MGIIGQVEVGTRDGVDEAAVDEELGEPDLRHLERRRPALLLRLHIRRRPVRAAAAVHLAPHRPPRSTRLLWGLGWGALPPWDCAQTSSAVLWLGSVMYYVHAPTVWLFGCVVLAS